MGIERGGQVTDVQSRTGKRRKQIKDIQLGIRREGEVKRYTVQSGLRREGNNLIYLIREDQETLRDNKWGDKYKV